MSNKGVELSLGWRDNIGGVSYSINGNFSYNKSNIDAYNGTYERTWVEDPNNKLTGGKWEDNIGKVSSGGTTPIVEGRMMNEYYLRNVYHGNGSYYNADGSVNPQGGPKTGMIRTEKDMAWVKDMIAAGYEFQPGKTVAKNKIWYGDYIYADSNNNGVYGDDNDYTFQKLPISLNTISVFRPLPHGKDSTSLWYGQELPDSAYIGGQPQDTTPHLLNGVVLSHNGLLKIIISTIPKIRMIHVPTSTQNIRVWLI